jgi:TorA maturation chaperone TorD
VSEAEAAREIEPEERARALWYAIVSRLFYAPADRELLEGLKDVGQGTHFETHESPFLIAWRGVREACATFEPEAVREEFESLFVGVGKAPVTPYTSAYAAPYAPDRHLLTLRETISEWGLARRERVFEAEDHVAALCDAMRWLIEQSAALEDQRAFFLKFVGPGVRGFCAGLEKSPAAAFYAKAGAFAEAFVDVEEDAFDMHTAA